MKACILGAGAVGGILACRLLEAGVDVAVVDVAPDVLARAREEGLELRAPPSSPSGPQPGTPSCTAAAGTMAGAGAAPRRRPRAACSDLADAGLVDVVFVCVKTALLETIAAGMRQAWRPGTVCVSFQNGIDPEEILAGVAGPDHTLRAVLNLGGHVEAPGIYRMTWFRPPNVLGALTPAGRTHAEAVAALLEQAGLATRVVADIKRHAFEKAVLNAALCPVCALTGLSMGQAMALPPTRELATVLLREGRAVGERQGWAFERTLDEWLLYLEGGAGHRTSMHADLRAGRPTEIGFINGKICEHGARLGVPTPFNQAMTWAVLGRERRAAAE